MASVAFKIAKGYWARPYSNPDFFGIGWGRSEKLFESRRSQGEFFSRPRRFQKNVGFEYSLDSNFDRITGFAGLTGFTRFVVVLPSVLRNPVNPANPVILSN